MPNFRIDEAYLIGAWCASAGWGFFSSLMIVAVVQIVQLQRKGQMSRSKWITATATILLYCLSTTHISLALRRLIVGFIYLQGPDTIPYFADIAQPLDRGKDLIYITSMVIADAVVVWRCYIIWNSNAYILAGLSTLIIGSMIAGYGAISQYFLTNPDPKEAANFGTAMFAVSLTTNVVVTALTVGRIWWITRDLSRNLGRKVQSKYRTILLLLLESGLLIAIAKVTEFTLFQMAAANGLGGFNALYIVFDIIPQINGVVPTLIIVAVNAKKTLTETQHISLNTATAPSRNLTVHASTLVFPSQNKTGRTVDGSASNLDDSKDTFLDYKNSSEGYTTAVPLGELRTTREPSGSDSSQMV